MFYFDPQPSKLYIQICQTNQFFASYYNQEASRGESDGLGHGHGRDGYSETETMQILGRTDLQSASSNSNEMQRHMYFRRAGETQMQHNFTPHISPPNYQVGRLIKLIAQFGLYPKRSCFKVVFVHICVILGSVPKQQQQRRPNWRRSFTYYK